MEKELSKEETLERLFRAMRIACRILCGETTKDTNMALKELLSTNLSLYKEYGKDKK